MANEITSILSESAALKARLAADAAFVSTVERSCELLFQTVRSGGTIFACGNGGSSCDAMHLVEELVAQYKRQRRGIRAMHFMEPAVTTCWSNDHSFSDVYRRYAEVFCSDKDVLVAISTSGNSKNVILAAQEAHKRGAKVIAMVGRDGGELAGMGDVTVHVPSQFTERVQEAHITVIHIWLELLETRYGLASGTV